MNREFIGWEYHTHSDHYTSAELSARFHSSHEPTIEDMKQHESTPKHTVKYGDEQQEKENNNNNNNNNEDDNSIDLTSIDLEEISNIVEPTHLPTSSSPTTPSRPLRSSNSNILTHTNSHTVEREEREESDENNNNNNNNES